MMRFFDGLKLSGLGAATVSGSELPCIVGLAAYRESVGSKTKPSVREWLVLNGMNAGRFTSFFGAPCVADTFDCLSILEARLESEELVVVRVCISLESMS